VIPQWHINRKPRPPRTDFKNVWDHTQNEDKTIKQPFILDMVLGDSPHIFCGFAMVKRTEWNVLTLTELKPHLILLPSENVLQWAVEWQKSHLLPVRMMPVAYETWFIDRSRLAYRYLPQGCKEPDSIRLHQKIPSNHLKWIKKRIENWLF